MMQINTEFFDVHDFVFTEHTREMTTFFNGKLVKISEEKLGDADIWIVPGAELQAALHKRFLPFYPMFFGMLLSAFHENKTQMPIHRIYWEDVDTAYEHHGQLQNLVDSIASGKYVPFQKT